MMTPEVTSALRVLYGKDVAAVHTLPENLDLEELKAVFHRRALELHPDRAAILGKSPDVLSEAFKDVKLAYEMLLDLLGPSLIKTVFTCRYSDREEVIRGPGNYADHYWEAGIPEVSLLFGQFLYYAGLITFNNLISAITWQRRQRPSFGKIARIWGYLSKKELRAIVFSRDHGERIGDTALRLGYLNRFQRDTVLGFQKYLQRPIGEFFRTIGVLEEEEIDYLVKLLQKHNTRIGRAKNF